MKKKLLLFITIIACFKIDAQTITVVDKSNLQPIENAMVNGKATNMKGQIAFEAINDKSGLIIVQRIGYFTDSFRVDELKAMLYIIRLTERNYDLEKVVVAVMRVEQKTSVAQQQIFSLDKAQMQFMSQPTTAELLQQSGRAFIQKSQMGGGSVVMRGFESNKVLMVVDGVRMNNAIYRGGHLQNVLTVDQNMLERTELVFGTGSVNYGSDALGGVVHFITKNPLLSTTNKPLTQTSAFLRYGTAMAEKTGHFDFNVGLKKWAFLGSATYSTFDDMTMGKRGTKNYASWGRRTFYTQRNGNKDSMVQNADSFKQVPSGYHQTDLMGKILFQESKYISHLLNVQHSTSSDIPRYDRLTELDSNGKPLQAQWYYGPQTRTFVSYKLAITKKMQAFDKATFIVGWQNIIESRHNRGFGSSNITHRTEQVEVYTVNADFQKSITSKTELRYGAEITTNDVQSKANSVNINTNAESAQTTRYPDGGSKMQTAAIYLTQTNILTSKFFINTGVRFTAISLECNFKDKTFFPFLQNSIAQRNQNTSGSIGFVYLPKTHLKIAGSVSSGYRAANVDDMAKVFESTAGRIIIPNAYVKPEQTTNFDLTINKTFAKKLSIELNAYYTIYNNALTLGRAQLNGKDTITYNNVTSTIYTTLNAQRAMIQGLFAGFNYDVNKALALSGNINYTYGRIKTDTIDYPLDHISPVFGRFGIIYKGNKFKTEFYTLFNGAKKSKDYNLSGEDNQLYSADPVKGFNPAWYTLNLRGFYQVNKYFQLQLAIENLLDQHYRTFSSGYSGAGRNVVVTLRGQF
jgi:hemoglobin/transferrin/lactoferrin receptor protein